MLKKFLLSAGVALVMSGCASTPPFRAGPGLILQPANELPPPIAIDPNSDTRPYFVGPFDTLSISVFGLPDLDRDVQVDAAGRLSFPLVGGLQVQGKTPEEIADAIEAGLRSAYIRDPRVSVNLKETVSQTVTLDGQVREPGMYPVVGRMTLMRAIASAKGATEYAKLEDVVVFRQVGDQRMAALYNLQAIQRGMYPDPEIFANDIVVVGDSPAKRRFRDILQAGGLIATPVIAVLQKL